MASQPDLRHPIGTCHHAEVSDGNLQFGTFLNHLFHLTNLHISISQFDAKNNTMLFHISEHMHHLVIQELNVQSCCRNLKSFKPLLYQLLGLWQETRLTCLWHSEAKETVRVLLLNLLQIAVLETVNKLLCDDSGRHLCIVHVRQKTFGSVLTIRHIWRQHLALLAKEDASATVRFQRVNGRTIHHCIYIQPQVSMRINNLTSYFFHQTSLCIGP